MNTRAILVLFFSLNSLIVCSQLNIQTGYDLGIIKFPKLQNADDYGITPDFKSKSNRQTNFNYVHRYNLLGEYKFLNNMLTSIGFGFDSYRNKYDNKTTRALEDECYVNSIKSDYYSVANILRFELSLGYSFELSSKSDIILKGSYGLFVVANHNIFKSSRITTKENVCTNHIEIQDSVMLDFIKLKDKYGDGIKTDWNQLFISAEYRHNFNHVNLNFYSAFTPNFNPNFLAGTASNFGGNLKLIFGLRLGYTLPQKTKNDEK